MVDLIGIRQSPTYIASKRRDPLDVQVSLPLLATPRNWVADRSPASDLPAQENCSAVTGRNPILPSDPISNRAQPLRKKLSALKQDGTEPDVKVLVAAVLEQVGTKALLTPRAGGGFDYSAPWDAVLRWLTEIGGVDLNVARLFEGHLNAVQLVGLYGTLGQQKAIVDNLRQGGLLGVWGADGSPPVSLQPNASAAGSQMAGSKRYASGAGIVKTAIVPVNQPDGILQLLLLPVDDEARIDLSSWNMRGMRGSASGTYRFDGVEVGPGEVLGGPDDYRQEPFFVGGIWRCAAAQLGAVEALVRIIAVSLKESGRDGHPLQMARIGKAIMKARTARLWIEDAAERVETYRPADGAEKLAETVALSAYGRLLTEEVAMSVIDLAERALGLEAFALGHPAEELMRDLAVYIRQANPDAVLLQHGRVLAAGLTA